MKAMLRALIPTTFLLSIAGCTSPTGADDGRATPLEVVAKVREPAALLDARGDDALDVLRNPTSPFTWKDTYVFVVDCAADRVLANPRFPERQGGDIKQHADYAGKPYGRRLCKIAAKPGGGWIEYVWLRPGTQTPSRKISFVMSAGDGAYQLGAGVYDDTLDLESLERLTAR